MQIGTKEHYELLDAFEARFSHMRLDREKDEATKRRGHVYQNGETNNAYQAFIQGYSLARSIHAAD